MLRGVTGRVVAAAAAVVALVAGEKAKLTVEQFQTDSNMGSLRDFAKKAKGMLILPQMVRAAFIVGGSGGSGVLIAREKAGKWNGPAFYTLAARVSAFRRAPTRRRWSS